MNYSSSVKTASQKIQNKKISIKIQSSKSASILEFRNRVGKNLIKNSIFDDI